MKTFAVLAVVCSVLAAGAALVPHRRQGSDQFVAFSAGLTQTVNLATNASVAFNKVWTNIGNGYDNTTGIFTCPTTGTYIFMYNGLSDTVGQMWLDLYKNGEYEITAYSHNNNDYASASNSIVLKLNAGDEVYIRGHGTSVLYGVGDEIYCTFSGFLLSANQGQ